MFGNHDAEVERLLDEIRGDVRSTRDMTGRASLAPRVMEAMRAVSRHDFVPEELRWAAYRNEALPIGHRQTISQPFIVALMSDLVEPQPGHVILEVGSGSGYQAAVLARLVKQVYTLEIVPELARLAAGRLRRLGVGNVEVREGNGRLGWPEHAPYDGILVTAAAPEIPPALIAQLKPGGTLVAPVGGGSFYGQDLVVLRKDEAGTLSERAVLPVIFVPLTGEADRREGGPVPPPG